MAEILIPIVLQSKMTNYQAGLMINNYVLWIYAGIFPEDEFL